VCEYDCASGSAHGQNHETAMPSAAPLVSGHQTGTVSAVLLAGNNRSSDVDCSSANQVIVAAGSTYNLLSPDRADIGMTEASPFAMPNHWHSIAAATGSPPLQVQTSAPISISLRI
jgi:hypothetical protein